MGRRVTDWKSVLLVVVLTRRDFPRQSGVLFHGASLGGMPVGTLWPKPAYGGEETVKSKFLVGDGNFGDIRVLC